MKKNNFPACNACKNPMYDVAPRNVVGCDGCKNVYHIRCLVPPVNKNPKVKGYAWYCAWCPESTSEPDESSRLSSPLEPTDDVINKLLLDFDCRFEEEARCLEKGPHNNHDVPFWTNGIVIERDDGNFFLLREKPNFDDPLGSIEDSSGGGGNVTTMDGPTRGIQKPEKTEEDVPAYNSTSKSKSNSNGGTTSKSEEQTVTVEGKEKMSDSSSKSTSASTSNANVNTAVTPNIDEKILNHGVGGGESLTTKDEPTRETEKPENTEDVLVLNSTSKSTSNSNVGTTSKSEEQTVMVEGKEKMSDSSSKSTSASTSNVNVNTAVTPNIDEKILNHGVGGGESLTTKDEPTRETEKPENTEDVLVLNSTSKSTSNSNFGTTSKSEEQTVMVEGKEKMSDSSSKSKSVPTSNSNADTATKPKAVKKKRKTKKKSSSSSSDSDSTSTSDLVANTATKPKRDSTSESSSASDSSSTSDSDAAASPKPSESSKRLKGKRKKCGSNSNSEFSSTSNLNDGTFAKSKADKKKLKTKKKSSSSSSDSDSSSTSNLDADTATKPKRDSTSESSSASDSSSTSNSDAAATPKPSEASKSLKEKEKMSDSSSKSKSGPTSNSNADTATKPKAVKKNRKTKKKSSSSSSDSDSSSTSNLDADTATKSKRDSTSESSSASDSSSTSDSDAAASPKPSESSKRLKGKRKKCGSNSNSEFSSTSNLNDGTFAKSKADKKKLKTKKKSSSSSSDSDSSSTSNLDADTTVVNSKERNKRRKGKKKTSLLNSKLKYDSASDSNADTAAKPKADKEQLRIKRKSSGSSSDSDYISAPDSNADTAAKPKRDSTSESSLSSSSSPTSNMDVDTIPKSGEPSEKLKRKKRTSDSSSPSDSSSTSNSNAVTTPKPSKPSERLKRMRKTSGANSNSESGSTSNSNAGTLAKSKANRKKMRQRTDSTSDSSSASDSDSESSSESDTPIKPKNKSRQVKKKEENSDLSWIGTVSESTDVENNNENKDGKAMVTKSVRKSKVQGNKITVKQRTKKAKSTRKSKVSKSEKKQLANKRERKKKQKKASRKRKESKNFKGLKIKVESSQKTEDGIRIYDRIQCCFICGKLLKKLTRHFETASKSESKIKDERKRKHLNNLQVQKMLSLEKKSAERRMHCLKLIRLGNFQRNLLTLSQKKGTLIVARRPVNSTHFSEFIPCLGCYAFIRRSHLNAHSKKCSSYRSLDSGNSIFGNKSIVREGQFILDSALCPDESPEFIKAVVNALKADEIGGIAKTDKLILKFGTIQFGTYGTSQAEFIRQRMRMLARLALELNKNRLSYAQLSEFLNPEKFDTIVQAVNSLAGKGASDDLLDRPKYKTPSLALKLGHLLIIISGIHLGSAIRNEDEVTQKKVKNFVKLLKLEWKTRISSNALNTLFVTKKYKVEELPLTSDLKNLNDFVKKNITYLTSKLKELPDKDKFLKLAHITLVRIILFNKRRSGEAGKLRIHTYSENPNWGKETNEELRQTLSPLEKKLEKNLVLIKERGKRNIVDTLLTPDVVEAINTLIAVRSEIGIPSSNPFIFARAYKESNKSLRGSDSLRKVIGECQAKNIQLENPDTIRGTKLRKYIATVTQLLDLSEVEGDWLARHLGHDIRVHREFYRLHESAVELTKISKLLLAVEDGQIHKLKGKNLDDIDLEEIPTPWLQEHLGNDKDTDEKESERNTESEEDQLIDVNGVNDDRDDRELMDSSCDSSDYEVAVPKKMKLTAKPRTIKKWTQGEIDAVSTFFETTLRTIGSAPGKAAAEECKKKYASTLKNRTWREIKNWVWNKLKVLKKKNGK